MVIQFEENKQQLDLMLRYQKITKQLLDRSFQ